MGAIPSDWLFVNSSLVPRPSIPTRGTHDVALEAIEPQLKGTGRALLNRYHDFFFAGFNFYQSSFGNLLFSQFGKLTDFDTFIFQGGF